MTKSVYEALENISKYLKNVNTHKFLIVNVNNVEDYLNIKSRLEVELAVIKISVFCNKNDDLPDFEKFLTVSCSTKKNSLLLGASEYLRLQDEASFDIQTQALLSSINKAAKVVVLYFDCEKKLKTLLDNDIRLKEKNQIILVKGNKAEKTSIKLLNSEIKISGSIAVIKGIKTYLDKFEEECSIHSIISTKYYDVDFSRASISIQKISSTFELLGILTPISGRISKSFGTEDNWKYICENINGNDVDTFITKEFGNLDTIEALFYKWKEWDINRKWLYFIALKLSNLKNKYLDFVNQKSLNVDDFISKLYSCILEFPSTSKEFDNLYKERKCLIGFVKDDSCNNEFCAKVKIMAKNRIYYLTDTTALEKEDILLWLSEQETINEDTLAILTRVSPELVSYLTEYDLAVDSYTDYFKKYKLQKLNNKIYDGFIDVVNENAQKREYNLLLKTRNEVFEKIDKTDSKIYFIDSLGVEFMGYISRLCSELGLNIEVSVTKANMPTTTYLNKDFLDNYRDRTIDIKRLDNIKHSGEGDYNYEFSKLPLHIFEELKIIRDAFVRIKADLSKSTVKKVIVVSDHGASRLVILYDNKITFPTETNGTQGGRCCKYVEGSEIPKYATIENGQCILASYDRFKTQGAPRVETHGGATLEELMVPIITVINEKEKVIATLVENIIIVSYKIKATLRIFITKQYDRISVKIKNKMYESTEIDGGFFTVPIYDIINIGEYKGEVFAAGQYIDEISFKLVKPTSGEKDLGI